MRARLRFPPAFWHTASWFRRLSALSASRQTGLASMGHTGNCKVSGDVSALNSESEQIYSNLTAIRVETPETIDEQLVLAPECGDSGASIHSTTRHRRAPRGLLIS